MKYLEFSKESLENEIDKFSKEISISYQPDSILFVAKGAFYLGLFMAKSFNVPLFQVKAHRKANKLKSIISPFFKFIPKNIKIFLRNIEIRLNIHKKSEKRNAVIENNKIYTYKNILLIDDSIDTGATILSILELFKNEDINIKVACLNFMTNSEIAPDYYIYKNTMISTPASTDSSSYKEFLSDYNNWVKDNG